jgi:putative DNA primase/helicase
MGLRMNAVAYVEKGWFVMPLKPQSKEPCKFLRHGYLDASNDITTVKRWFKDEDLNIGIGLIQSNLVVLDFDIRNASSRTLWEQYRRMCVVSDTFTVKTDDGYHFYYLANKDKQFKGKLIPGIDIKHKGYVVAHPSIHPNGTKYQVVNNIDPVELPAELEKVMSWN